MEPGENHHEQDCCLAQQTVADIPDGATAAIACFGVADRFATSLICALREQRTKEHPRLKLAR
jgi:hypothetical protein